MDNFEFLTYLDGIAIEEFFTTIRDDVHIDEICQTIASIGGYCCLILGIVQLARHFMSKRPAPPLMLVMTYFTLAVGGLLVAPGSWTNSDVTGMTGWATMVKNTVKNMANSGGGGPAGAQSPGWWGGGSGGYNGLTSYNGSSTSSSGATSHLTSGNDAGWTASTDPSATSHLTSSNGTNWVDSGTPYADVASAAKDYIRNRLSGNDAFKDYYRSVYGDALANQMETLYNAYITNPATAFSYMTKEEFTDKILSEAFANKAGAVQNKVLQELLAKTQDAYDAKFAEAGGNDLLELGKLGNDAIVDAYKAQAMSSLTEDMWNTDSNMRNAYRQAREDKLNANVEAAVDNATFTTRSVTTQEYVRDADGNIVYETKYRTDSEGNVMTDAEGNPIVANKVAKTTTVTKQVVDSYTYTIDGHTVTKTVTGDYDTEYFKDNVLKNNIRGEVAYAYNEQTNAMLNDNAFLSDTSVNTTQYAKEMAAKNEALALYNKELNDARAAAQKAKNDAVKDAHAKANAATIDTLKNSSDPADQALYQSIMADVDARVNDPNTGYDASRQQAETQYENKAKQAVQAQAQANAKAQANEALATQLDNAVNYIYNQDSLIDGQGSLANYLNSSEDRSKGTIDQMLAEWSKQTRSEWGGLVSNP